MEKTLVLVKPDGVRKNLSGEVISRFEKRGLRVAGLKMMRMHDGLAKKHYAEHAGKPFFPELVAFITSGPIVALAIEGQNVIRAVRGMMGATNPLDAAPGSIRGDFALMTAENMVHGSDSPESAACELANFFTSDELF